MRDDFTDATKRVIAQRAGGRCSFPGCDILCWLPSNSPNKAYTVGVAAHINAASSGGPRYDKDQSEEERSSPNNSIYLCQNHAHIIDADYAKYDAEKLQEWKHKHENQISGEASGEWLFPEIRIERTLGMSVSAKRSQIITANTIGNGIESCLIFRNSSDYEYRRLGFTVQYPEFVEDEPSVDSPPGFSHKIIGENMDWEVAVGGSGKVVMPKITKYGSFTLEGSSLLQRQSLRVMMRTFLDPISDRPATDGKIYFFICGEVDVNLGSILKTQGFTVPLFYDKENRVVSTGYIHQSDPNGDVYVQMRCY